MTVRRVGFVILALAAAIITFALAPEPPEEVNVAGYDRQLSQALSDYEENDARTQGAPQQQVVNGWIARDMLTILAQQTNELLEVSAPAASDDRIPLLLLVLVLAVCWQATAPSDLAPARRSRPADLNDEVVAEPAAGPDPWSADQLGQPVGDPAGVDDRRP